MRYLWCCCTPDGDVLWLDRDAVRLHITEKDELLVCRVMSDEKASAVILTRVVHSVADGHEANGDIWEDDLVFVICTEATKRGW